MNDADADTAYMSRYRLLNNIAKPRVINSIERYWGCLTYLYGPEIIKLSISSPRILLILLKLIQAHILITKPVKIDIIDAATQIKPVNIISIGLTIPKYIANRRFIKSHEFTRAINTMVLSGLSGVGQISTLEIYSKRMMTTIAILLI